MRIGPRIDISSAVGRLRGPLQSFDFTTQAAGVGTLPSWLSYTRASGATVQTSASTVQTGLTNDGPPIANRGSGSRLCFEGARTNSLKDCSDYSTANWTVYGFASVGPGAVAPDGSTSKLITDANATSTAGTYQTPGTASTRSLSAWIKHEAGSVAGVSTAYSGSYIGYDDGSGSWSRADATSPGATTSGVFPGLGNPFANASVGSAHFWGAQLENGAHPSSLVVTAGAAAARAGARLRNVEPAKAIINGRLELDFDIEPLGASTELSTDGAYAYLWYIDASNYARISTATLRLTVCIDGVTWTPTTALPAWSRGQRLRLSVAAGGGSLPSRAAYALGAGDWTAIGESVDAHAAIAVPDAFDYLSGGGSGHFFADMRRAPDAWGNGGSYASRVAAGLAYELESELNAYERFRGDGYASGSWTGRIRGIVASQGTAGSRPTTVANSANFNNRATASFDGGDYLVTPAFADTISQPFAVYAVARSTLAGSQGVVCDGISASNRAVVYDRFNVVTSFVTSDLQSGLPWNTLTRIVCAVFNGAASELYVDAYGTPAAATGNTGASQTLTGLTIGATYLAAIPWIGEVADLFLVPGVNALAKRQRVMQSLGDYYGKAIGA